MVLLIDNSINIKPTFIIGDNLMVQNQVILSDQGNRELSNDGVAIKSSAESKVYQSLGWYSPLWTLNPNQKEWKPAKSIAVTCIVWKMLAGGSIHCKCKPLFIAENQGKGIGTVSLYAIYLGTPGENARDDEKRNQKIQNVGAGNLKTRVKRKRLGKCDIEGKSQGEEILLRALQVI